MLMVYTSGWPLSSSFPMRIVKIYIFSHKIWINSTNIFRCSHWKKERCPFICRKFLFLLWRFKPMHFVSWYNPVWHFNSPSAICISLSQSLCLSLAFCQIEGMFVCLRTIYIHIYICNLFFIYFSLSLSSSSSSFPPSSLLFSNSSHSL